MNHRLTGFALACLVAASMALALLLAAAATKATSDAWPAATNRHVAPGGNCGGATPCYATIQAAVDAATPGDIIKVAAGAYNDISARPRADIVATGIVTQVVYLAKTLTVRGGYATTNWAIADPAANPAILDARGQGRVLYITGAISPTIEGLYLTGGRADTDDWYEGGGVYAITATVVFSNNRVFNCFAQYGGGVYLEDNRNTVLRGNQIYSNAVGDEGGGIYVWNSIGLTLTDNLVHDNTAEGTTGGIYMAVSDGVTLTSNQIYMNRSAGDGGGLDFSALNNVTLTDNQINGNQAEGNGGGINCTGSSFVLQGNRISDNSAAGNGGGVHLSVAVAAVLTSNQVNGNHADDGSGGGIAADASAEITLAGNQVYDNVAYEGGGIYLAASDNSHLTSNAIYGNQVAGDGGGVHFSASGNPTLVNNRIYNNTADGAGGGAYFLWAIGGLTLTGNQVYSNTAGAEGGGICALSSDGVILTANRISGNVAGGEGGGGVYLVNTHDAALVNDVVSDNRNSGGAPGTGIYLDYTRDLRLIHATIARNRGGDGSAIFITDSIGAGGPPSSSVALTNTILVGHRVGISVTTGNRVAVNGILWYDTPITVTKGATATVTVSNQITGNPGFAPDGYHLTASSAAVDKGINTAITDDFDGERRPQCVFTDLGADELALRCSYLPLSLRR